MRSCPKTMQHKFENEQVKLKWGQFYNLPSINTFAFSLSTLLVLSSSSVVTLFLKSPRRWRQFVLGSGHLLRRAVRACCLGARKKFKKVLCYSIFVNMTSQTCLRHFLNPDDARKLVKPTGQSPTYGAVLSLTVIDRCLFGSLFEHRTLCRGRARFGNIFVDRFFKNFIDRRQFFEFSASIRCFARLQNQRIVLEHMRAACMRFLCLFSIVLESLSPGSGGSTLHAVQIFLDSMILLFRYAGVISYNTNVITIIDNILFS